MTASLPASRHGAYSVPQRFGISAILALTTLFAFIFAFLRGFNAPPVVYLFFGTLAVAICLAQMIFGQVPRISSIVAGALLLPFWVLVTGLLDERAGGFMNAVALAVATTPFSLVGGAFLGYLTGAVLAGFFLLLDMAQAPKPMVMNIPPQEVNANELLNREAQKDVNHRRFTSSKGQQNSD